MLRIDCLTKALCWQAARDSEQALKQKASAKETALLEYKTRLLLTDKGLLGKVIDDTVGNIEKKQARTYEELQAEQAEAEEVKQHFTFLLFVIVNNSPTKTTHQQTSMPSAKLASWVPKASMCA